MYVTSLRTLAVPLNFFFVSSTQQLAVNSTAAGPTPSFEHTLLVLSYGATIKLVQGFVAAPVFGGLFLRPTPTTPSTSTRTIMSSSTPPQLFINNQWRDAG